MHNPGEFFVYFVTEGDRLLAIFPSLENAVFFTEKYYEHYYAEPGIDITIRRRDVELPTARGIDDFNGWIDALDKGVGYGIGEVD